MPSALLILLPTPSLRKEISESEINAKLNSKRSSTVVNSQQKRWAIFSERFRYYISVKILDNISSTLRHLDSLCGDSVSGFVSTDCEEECHTTVNAMQHEWLWLYRMQSVLSRIAAMGVKNSIIGVGFEPNLMTSNYYLQKPECKWISAPLMSRGLFCCDQTAQTMTEKAFLMELARGNNNDESKVGFGMEKVEVGGLAVALLRWAQKQIPSRPRLPDGHPMAAAFGKAERATLCVLLHHQEYVSDAMVLARITVLLGEKSPRKELEDWQSRLWKKLKPSFVRGVRVGRWVLQRGQALKQWIQLIDTAEDEGPEALEDELSRVQSTTGKLNSLCEVAGLLSKRGSDITDLEKTISWLRAEVRRAVISRENKNSTTDDLFSRSIGVSAFDHIADIIISRSNFLLQIRPCTNPAQFEDNSIRLNSSELKHHAEVANAGGVRDFTLSPRATRMMRSSMTPSRFGLLKKIKTNSMTIDTSILDESIPFTHKLSPISKVPLLRSTSFGDFSSNNTWGNTKRYETSVELKKKPLKKKISNAQKTGNIKYRNLSVHTGGSVSNYSDTQGFSIEINKAYEHRLEPYEVVVPMRRSTSCSLVSPSHHMRGMALHGIAQKKVQRDGVRAPIWRSPTRGSMGVAGVGELAVHRSTEEAYIRMTMRTAFSRYVKRWGASSTSSEWEEDITNRGSSKQLDLALNSVYDFLTSPPRAFKVNSIMHVLLKKQSAALDRLRGLQHAAQLVHFISAPESLRMLFQEMGSGFRILSSISNAPSGESIKYFSSSIGMRHFLQGMNGCGDLLQQGMRRHWESILIGIVTHLKRATNGSINNILCEQDTRSMLIAALSTASLQFHPRDAAMLLRTKLFQALRDLIRSHKRETILGGAVRDAFKSLATRCLQFIPSQCRELPCVAESVQALQISIYDILVDQLSTEALNLEKEVEFCLNNHIHVNDTEIQDNNEVGSKCLPETKEETKECVHEFETKEERNIDSKQDTTTQAYSPVVQIERKLPDDSECFAILSLLYTQRWSGSWDVYIKGKGMIGPGLRALMSLLRSECSMQCNGNIILRTDGTPIASIHTQRLVMRLLRLILPHFDDSDIADALFINNNNSNETSGISCFIDEIITKIGRLALAQGRTLCPVISVKKNSDGKAHEQNNAYDENADDSDTNEFEMNLMNSFAVIVHCPPECNDKEFIRVVSHALRRRLSNQNEMRIIISKFSENCQTRKVSFQKNSNLKEPKINGLDYTLHIGTHGVCYQIAMALALSGIPVSVCPMLGECANRNRQRMHTKKHRVLPAGHISLVLISESIALLRSFLLKNSKNDSNIANGRFDKLWKTSTRRRVNLAWLKVGTIANKLEEWINNKNIIELSLKQNLPLALGAVLVAGGALQEPLRLGGRVILGASNNTYLDVNSSQLLLGLQGRIGSVIAIYEGGERCQIVLDVELSTPGVSDGAPETVIECDCSCLAIVEEFSLNDLIQETQSPVLSFDDTLSEALIRFIKTLPKALQILNDFADDNISTNVTKTENAFSLRMLRRCAVKSAHTLLRLMKSYNNSFNSNNDVDDTLKRDCVQHNLSFSTSLQNTLLSAALSALPTGLAGKSTHQQLEYAASLAINSVIQGREELSIASNDTNVLRKHFGVISAKDRDQNLIGSDKKKTPLLTFQHRMPRDTPLPCRFNPTSAWHCMFLDDSRQSARFLGFSHPEEDPRRSEASKLPGSPRQFGMRSQQDIVLITDNEIPTAAPLFYFEATIESLENNNRDSPDVWVGLHRGGLQACASVGGPQKPRGSIPGRYRWGMGCEWTRGSLCFYSKTGSKVSSMPYSGVTRFRVGEPLDIKDTTGAVTWRPALVSQNIGDKVKVHYMGWENRWDEWIEKASDRILPYRSKTYGTRPRYFMKHEPYGIPCIQSRDVIGCGWNRQSGEVFFTVNGRHLGNAFHNVSSQMIMFPAIAVRNKHVIVRINCGTEPFLYQHNTHLIELNNIPKSSPSPLEYSVDSESWERYDNDRDDADRYGCKGDELMLTQNEERRLNSDIQDSCEDIEKGNTHKQNTNTVSWGDVTNVTIGKNLDNTKVGDVNVHSVQPCACHQRRNSARELKEFFPGVSTNHLMHVLYAHEDDKDRAANWMLMYADDLTAVANSSTEDQIDDCRGNSHVGFMIKQMRLSTPVHSPSSSTNTGTKENSSEMKVLNNTGGSRFDDTTEYVRPENELEISQPLITNNHEQEVNLAGEETAPSAENVPRGYEYHRMNEVVETGEMEEDVTYFKHCGAIFGGELPNYPGLRLPLVRAFPADASTPLIDPQECMRGRCVVVDRGTCGFAIKAMHAQQAGACAMLVISNEEDLSGKMGLPDDIDPYASPDTESRDIEIASLDVSQFDSLTIRSVMISKTDGEKVLRAINDPSSQPYITMHVGMCASEEDTVDAELPEEEHILVTQLVDEFPDDETGDDTELELSGALGYNIRAIARARARRNLRAHNRNRDLSLESRDVNSETIEEMDYPIGRYPLQISPGIDISFSGRRERHAHFVLGDVLHQTINETSPGQPPSSPFLMRNAAIDEGNIRKRQSSRVLSPISFQNRSNSNSPLGMLTNETSLNRTILQSTKYGKHITQIKRGENSADYKVPSSCKLFLKSSSGCHQPGRTSSKRFNDEVPYEAESSAISTWLTGIENAMRQRGIDAEKRSQILTLLRSGGENEFAMARTMLQDVRIVLSKPPDQKEHTSNSSGNSTNSHGDCPIHDIGLITTGMRVRIIPTIQQVYQWRSSREKREEDLHGIENTPQKQLRHDMELIGRSYTDNRTIEKDSEYCTQPTSWASAFTESWLPEMDCTAGCVGRVSEIDGDAKLVRVTIYIASLGILYSWWYPIVLLSVISNQPELRTATLMKNIKIQAPHVPRTKSVETTKSAMLMDLMGTSGETEDALFNVYARKLVLQLALWNQHDPISVADALLPKCDKVPEDHEEIFEYISDQDNTSNYYTAPISLFAAEYFGCIGLDHTESFSSIDSIRDIRCLTTANAALCDPVTYGREDGWAALRANSNSRSLCVGRDHATDLYYAKERISALAALRRALPLILSRCPNLPSVLLKESEMIFDKNTVVTDCDSIVTLGLGTEICVKSTAGDVTCDVKSNDSTYKPNAKPGKHLRQRVTAMVVTCIRTDGETSENASNKRGQRKRKVSDFQSPWERMSRGTAMRHLEHRNRGNNHGYTFGIYEGNDFSGCPIRTLEVNGMAAMGTRKDYDNDATYANCGPCILPGNRLWLRILRPEKPVRVYSPFNYMRSRRDKQDVSKSTAFCIGGLVVTPLCSSYGLGVWMMRAFGKGIYTPEYTDIFDTLGGIHNLALLRGIESLLSIVSNPMTPPLIKQNASVPLCQLMRLCPQQVAGLISKQSLKHLALIHTEVAYLQKSESEDVRQGESHSLLLQHLIEVSIALHSNVSNPYGFGIKFNQVLWNNFKEILHNVCPPVLPQSESAKNLNQMKKDAKLQEKAWEMESNHELALQDHESKLVEGLRPILETPGMTTELLFALRMQMRGNLRRRNLELSAKERADLESFCAMEDNSSPISSNDRNIRDEEVPEEKYGLPSDNGNDLSSSAQGFPMPLDMIIDTDGVVGGSSHGDPPETSNIDVDSISISEEGKSEDSEKEINIAPIWIQKLTEVDEVLRCRVGGSPLPCQFLKSAWHGHDSKVLALAKAYIDDTTHQAWRQSEKQPGVSNKKQRKHCTNALAILPVRGSGVPVVPVVPELHTKEDAIYPPKQDKCVTPPPLLKINTVIKIDSKEGDENNQIPIENLSTTGVSAGLHVQSSLQQPKNPRESRVSLTSDFTQDEAFVAAIELMQKWSFQADEELVLWLNDISEESSLESNEPATTLSADRFYKGAQGWHLYKTLHRFSSNELQLRVLVLQRLNLLLKDTLQLIHASLSCIIFISRGLIFTNVKSVLVEQVLSSTAAATAVTRPKVAVNRFAASMTTGGMTNVTQDNTNGQSCFKNTVFGQAFGQLSAPGRIRGVSKGAWQLRQHNVAPHLSFEVRFKNERVVGEGGPYREFFADIARELQLEGNSNKETERTYSDTLGNILFDHKNDRLSSENLFEKNIVKEDADNGTLHTKSMSGMRNHLHTLPLFRFLGQLMGVAIRTRVHLPLALTSLFWKPLVGEQPLRSDLAAADQTLTRGAAKLAEARAQIDAIRLGIADVLPPAILSFLTWRELERRVCGKATVDIALLQRHTVYGSGVDPRAAHVHFFWKVLRGFSTEERQRFIRFAWGQSRLPATDADFRLGKVRMLLKNGRQKQTRDIDHSFPRADTCFFNVELPRYSTLEVMKRQLTTVIQMDWGLDGDDVELS
eukprot:GSMAST32.ASY1.ANO1.1902.1 assembled CDS